MTESESLLHHKSRMSHPPILSICIHSYGTLTAGDFPQVAQMVRDGARF